MHRLLYMVIGGVELDFTKIITANTGDDTLTIINNYNPYDIETIKLWNLKLEKNEKLNGLGKNKMGPCDLSINNKDQLLILCSFDDSILKIDLEKKMINDIVKVGRSPASLKFHDGKIYVVNSDSNSLTIIDEENFNIIENICLGEKPTDIQIDVNNNKAYITNSNNYSICIFDLKDGKIDIIKLDTQPIKALICNNFLYVLSYLNNGVIDYSNISAIEIHKGEVIWTYKLKGIFFDFIKVGDYSDFYLINPEDGFLYFFKSKERKLRKIINLGTMPGKIIMDEEKNIYITDLLKDQLIVVGGKKLDLIKKIRVGKEPQGILLL